MMKSYASVLSLVVCLSLLTFVAFTESHHGLGGRLTKSGHHVDHEVKHVHHEEDLHHVLQKEGPPKNVKPSSNERCGKCPEKEKEKALFDENTLREIIEKRDPLPPPSSEDLLFAELTEFKNQVVVLLVIVRDIEGWAVLNYMTPPVDRSGQPLYEGNRTINFYNAMRRTMLTLGMFGGHRTALLWDKKGDDSRVEIDNSLQLVSNVELIAGVGVAFGTDSSKTLLADVLVSTTIDGIGNVRWEAGTLTFEEGDNRSTRIEQRALDVFATEVADWTFTAGFKVSSQGRIAKAHTGVILGIPWFINDAKIRDQAIKNSPLAIGGDSEGQVLAAIHNDFLDLNPPRKIDVIVIKGVSNFADGNAASSKSEWDLTSALAAAGYMDFKLRQTGGQIYRISGSLESSNRASDVASSIIHQQPPREGSSISKNGEESADVKTKLPLKQDYL